MSLLAFAVVAAGCSKDDGEKTYEVPTESKTDTDYSGGKVVRTQVLKEGIATAVITYSFDGITYEGQDWKIYFTTSAKATAAGVAYQVYYATKEPQVSYADNIVTIHYPLNSGPGDEKLAAAGNLEAVKSIVEKTEFISEILSIFNIGNK